MAKQHFQVSIIICSLNGERNIESCLKSVYAQDYPSDSYTVILVDDGSTDRTVEIARSYPVRIVSHKRNMGVSYARNTGLKHSRGDVIVYLDDDCVVARNWLKELVKPLENEQVVAVGARLTAYKTDRLSERFMEATGYGNPAPIATGGGKTLAQRFFTYLRSMYSPLEASTQPVEVQAVYTACVAYRLTALRAIGGFDGTLRSDEDADVSVRLRAQRGKLVFSPMAKARHIHHEHIWLFIRQTFYRSGNTYHYYKKQGKTPPLFPFPLLYLMITVVLAPFFPLLAILFLAIGPILVYNWWLVRMVRTRSVENIVYAYIQFAVELATLAGLLRGYTQRDNRYADGQYGTRTPKAS